MEKENKYRVLFYVLLAVMLFGWLRYNKLRESNSILKDQVIDYQYALRRANENIDEANSTIEDAKSSAWSNYQEMGDTLDNLDTVDTISEP